MSNCWNRLDFGDAGPNLTTRIPTSLVRGKHRDFPNSFPAHTFDQYLLVDGPNLVDASLDSGVVRRRSTVQGSGIHTYFRFLETSRAFSMRIT